MSDLESATSMAILATEYVGPSVRGCIAMFGGVMSWLTRRLF